MEGEASQQMRAWVEYYRDLGIYDFYRASELSLLSASDLEQSLPAVIEVLDHTVDSTTADAGSSTRPPFDRVDVVHSTSAPASNVESMAVRPIPFNDLAPMPTDRIPSAARADALALLKQDIGDCTRCPLAYAGRHTIVFGDGSPNARLMFVGEGPGADEDMQGIPFIGKAGQLLNNMIAAMGVERADVYIANIVKCRPPANRVPEPVEANTCSQFIVRQIDVVQPQVIVALGSTAAMYLLGVKQSLSSLRGQWYSCRGAKVAVTYHPAFLLRDPRQKAEAWKDLQRVMVELGLTAPARK